MYRSGKKDILNHEGTKFVNSVFDEEQKISKNLLNVRRIHLMANYHDHGPYMYTGHQSISHVGQERHGWQSTKIGNLDHQICNMIRERMPDRNLVCMSQSQSFTNSPLIRQSLSYRDSTKSAAIIHTSRLNQYAYMSPPSPHWATVGNIMTVKRSTSMPGSRPNSVTLPSNESREDNQSLMKKKCGPFQCLKYQFRRSGHKDVPANNINQTKTNLNTSLEAGKISKSMFKKKTVTPSNCGQSSLNKPRGIRKSISLLFSKSNRSSKSDPSIIDQKETSKNPSKMSLQHTSRRNRSYESMLESGETKLSSDTNKYCSYSDVQDSSSLNKTKIAGSVDLMRDRRSPSEMSLSDSDSLCSSENQLSSQTAICYGNNSYRTSDSGWKVVVGNVCRSNSKDSAIANSTLSGDGIIQTFSEEIDDLKTDIPLIWNFMAEFLERLIINADSDISFYKTIFESQKSTNDVANCISLCLKYAADRLGQDVIKKVFTKCNWSFEDFGETTETFLRLKNLDFLLETEVNNPLYFDKYKYKLISLLPNDDEVVNQYLDDNFGSEIIQTEECVYFVSCCVFSHISNLSPEEITTFLDKKKLFFLRLLFRRSEFEKRILEALNDSIDLFKEKESGLLEAVIYGLSDNILSYEAFQQFLQNADTCSGTNIDSDDSDDNRHHISKVIRSMFETRRWKFI